MSHQTQQPESTFAACNECFHYDLLLDGLCWPCTRDKLAPVTPAPAPTQSMYDLCQDMRQARRSKRSAWK